jgi:hypothetical protein
MFKVEHITKDWKEAGSFAAQINLYGFWDEHCFLTKTGDLGMCSHRRHRLREPRPCGARLRGQAARSGLPLARRQVTGSIRSCSNTTTPRSPRRV